MNDNMSEYFSFFNKDFASCTGVRKDAQYLHSRFKRLFESLKNNDIFTHEFNDFSGYPARPWNQGSKTFRNYIWIGFANSKYREPRDEIQFQVSLFYSNLNIQLFIDKRAIKTRQRVRDIIQKHQTEFISICNKLTDSKITYWGRDEDGYEVKCDKLTEFDLKKILEGIAERQSEFYVVRRLTPSKTIRYSNEIVPEILHTWQRYLPLLNLLENKPDEPKSKEGTQIRSKRSIQSNTRKLFPTQEVNINETSAKAAERESCRISYENNWEAQDRANKDHQNTVLLLSKYLESYAIKPMQSVIDVLVENKNQIFIFEVKSIHTNNYIHQTRMALGQLLDYEYSQVKVNPDNKGKRIYKGIVYSEKPPQEIIDFLESIPFAIYWVESNTLSGSKRSMKKLREFITSD